MRSGNLHNRIKFYAKVSIRDLYNASVDSWPIATITTRGEVRYVGGNRTLNNEEKFYSKSIELTVRYRSDIDETMRVQIDENNDLYIITYKEILGKNEAIRLTLEKLADGIVISTVDAPTNLAATLDEECDIILTWTNNEDGDAVSIERSEDGINYTVIHQTAAGVSTYTDTYLEELTRYWYRIRAIHYSNYSSYAAIDDAVTDEYILPPAITYLEILMLSPTQAQLYWDWMGVDAYQVWESSTEDGIYTQLGGNLTDNIYVHTIVEGSTHWYKIRCVRNVPLLYGEFSDAVQNILWVGELTQDIIDNIALFYGSIDNITDNKLYNEVTGTSDYISVSGSTGSYTFQCPNTAPYISADTDYIWFKSNGNIRTTTEAELIGYDLQRTPVKYDDESPLTLRTILILKSDITLSEDERNALFNSMQLSILWDNSFNEYGHIKENRFTQLLWIPEPIWEDELFTYIEGLETELSENQLEDINSLIISLKSGLQVSYLSDYFDVFTLTGGETSESSLKNLVKNAHHGTLGGISPSFSQYEGFNSVGKTGYIDSNFNPSTEGINFTQTSNAIGFYTRNDVGVGSTSSVVGNGTTSRWMLRYTGDYVRGSNNGSVVASALSSNSATKGFYVFCRDVNNIRISKNSSSLTTNANNAAALNNFNYYILGLNNAGTFQYGSDSQCSCYFFSKLPTIDEIIIINNAIETYMDSKGKGIQ